jgi:hypothetical protein
MSTCTICHFEVEMDDVELVIGDSHCVCLSCYIRESESERPMPKALRREIIEALALMSEAV